MFYYGDKLEAINAHLDYVRTKWIVGAGEARDLAATLLSCIAEIPGDRRSYTQKRNDLHKLIDPDNAKQMSDVFSGEYQDALGMLLGDRSAKMFQKIWERCTLYPFSLGWFRRPFRSQKNSMLYLDRNLSLLQDMVYASAFGEIDIANELMKNEHAHEHMFSRLKAAMIAAEIDDGNGEILDIASSIIYGENEGGLVSRELIAGLLMSRSEAAHKMVGDLLLAAKLQEGLRQAIVESMDEGSRQGFLHILRLIIDNNLIRFSSVVRAFDTWTGLGVPPDRPAAIGKCFETAYACLTDNDSLESCLRSADALQVYIALWAVAFDEVTDVEPLLLDLIKDAPKYRKLTALYLLHQTWTPRLQNLIACETLAEGDPEVLAWSIQNLFTDGVITGYNFAVPDIRSLPREYPPERVYGLLETVLKKFGKKETVFRESLFPWCTLTLTASEIVQKQIYCAGMTAERQHYVDRLLDLREKMSIGVRHGFIQNFLCNPTTEKQKVALVEALGDKSSHVRGCAGKILSDMVLTSDDFLIIVGLLRHRAGDLRRSCITLLLRQEPVALLAAIGRLLESKNENKRLGAIELVAALRENERFSGIRSNAEEMILSLEPSTQTESIRAKEVADAKQPVYTPENGFGLYDPAKLHTPIVRQPRNAVELESALSPPVKRIQDIYTELSELIHEHREHQYETIDHDGSKSTNVLGSQCFLNPLTWSASTARETIDNYPLRGVWEKFFADMELAKDLLSVAFARQCAGGPVFDAQEFLRNETGLGLSESDSATLREFFSGLPYERLCTSILGVLTYSIPAKERFDMAYSVCHGLLHAVPSSLFRKLLTSQYAAHRLICPSKQEFYFGDSSQLNYWLDATKRAADSDDLFSRYFNIAYSFYRASDYKSERRYSYCSLETADFGRAFGLGLIDENEVLFELMGRQASPVHLERLTNQMLRKRREAAQFESLLDESRLAIRRITQMEVAGGEMTTCVSHLAASTRRCYGVDTFVSILLKMEKDSYVRGYNAVGRDNTKKEMLSHLLKCCYPDAGDDHERLRHLLSGRAITDAQLIDAAMYAPQWLDIVQDYLQWPGLKSAAWYFRAHMNDYFWDEEQTVIARYSPIEPADFRDGAFDVAWFWDAYNTLGEKRFGIVYQSARYLASSSQHRRAQLFADAVRGKLDVDRIEQEIREKRNKDRLLAYALIPIADKADVLDRYEFIQGFVKQAKTFGAQRQASETTAGRIALSNLARNAGYQDANRFMWQMETEKLHEVSPLLAAPQQVEDCELHLMVDSGGMAEISVIRNGKQLRDIPSNLKKHELCQRLKAVQKDLKQQHSRARASLENAMVSEDMFSTAELATLEQNPVIAPLIRNLVFVADTKHGYWREGELVSPGGSALEVAESTQLKIAHPKDLLEMGVWAKYQRDLFDRRIVQPFKQVFREFYRPNADELKELTHSTRYAGHQVQPKKTLALLKSRGWTASYEEGLQKTNFKDNVVVSLCATMDWFSPADIEAPTLESVTFHYRKTYEAVPIDRISPILFSETMRDIDLVVSVAHAGGVDPEASLSTMEMRESLLGEMLRLLGIENVELRTTHAFIRGKLGEYTVHLGSGTVQKMAAGSMFIVPVHSQHRGRVFLPFMDDDPKTAEIVSKIVLLAEDSKIKDPEILRQVRS